MGIFIAAQSCGSFVSIGPINAKIRLRSCFRETRQNRWAFPNLLHRKNRYSLCWQSIIKLNDWPRLRFSRRGSNRSLQLRSQKLPAIGRDWASHREFKVVNQFLISSTQISIFKLVTNRTYKIGAVSYLNSVPLIHELGKLAPEYEIVLDLPSRLADRLAAGEMDVALIPSVEVALADDLTIVSDACIGCFGPVWSVKLLSQVPVESIRSVALDEGSRTSVALVKLWLQQRHGIVADYCRLAMDDDYRDVETDAVLVIGDRAMQSSQAGFSHQYDLGQCWQEWTGMPFVFAVWAARPCADLDRLAAVLSEARDQGVAMAASIAKNQAAKYDLSVGQCLRYFTEFLNFRLGEAEKASLQVFCRRASELSLIPANNELRFHDCEVA